MSPEKFSEVAGDLNTRSGKWTKGVSKYAPGIIRGALAAVIPFLFHVDVRPVQATLDYRYPHHIIAFNQLNERPSMRSICAMGLESEECLNQLDVEKLCDKNSQIACIYLVKGRRFSTVEGYTLITAANKGSPTDRLVKSLFVSEESPLTKNDIAPDKLKVEYLTSFQGLPEVAPEAAITITKEQAAQTLYDALWDSCGVHGSCPGKVDDAFLKRMKDKITTDAEGALAEMIQKSKYN
jgi:hypothetical protein